MKELRHIDNVETLLAGIDFKKLMPPKPVPEVVGIAIDPPMEKPLVEIMIDEPVEMMPPPGVIE